MNNKLEEVIKGIGIMCELWLVTYQKFCEMGLPPDDAKEHTAELVRILLTKPGST